MTWTQMLIVAVTVLEWGAAVCYALSVNWRLATVWFCYGVINIAITW